MRVRESRGRSSHQEVAVDEALGLQVSTLLQGCSLHKYFSVAVYPYKSGCFAPTFIVKPADGLF